MKWFPNLSKSSLKRVPLRNKILRMMFAVGFLPIVLLSLLSFYSIRVFHESDVASIETNLVNQKTEEIEAFINSIVSTFQLKVSFEQVSDIELSGQYFILKQLLTEFPDIQEISFINIAGHETSRINRSFQDGVPVEELQDQYGSEKYIKAGDGQNYISPVYVTSVGPSITVAAPVFNRNNILISILTGEVSLKNLQNIVERSKLGTTGYLYVVAKDGFLIAHSQKNRLNSPSLSGTDFVKKVVGTNSGTPETSRYTSIWGEEVVASGKFIDDFQMGVISEWPVQEADLVLNTLNSQNLAFSLLALAGTLFFSFIIAGRIVKPIKTLETGTNLIAQGKFDQPIDIRTGDEIEDLGISFNKMMAGLKRLEELKKEFVFIAAHDLRTPVTAIRGYLDMVLDGSFGTVEPSVKEVLGKVARANQRLIQLVNDLLQVARAEAGRIPIKVAAMNITEPIRDILVELKPLADEKNIPILYQPGENLPQVLADPERVKELMVNLVSNAIKYTLGSETVTISHEIKDNKLITKIKDSGMGISFENQKKLFEKYFRVEDDKTKNIQGTGLGLFIVKQIIEKMNGTIWVESEEGKGSTFSFALPVAPTK